MKRTVEIGILYSLSGNYRILSKACHAGAMAGIAAVNGDARRTLTLNPVERDPHGRIDLYAPACEDILRSTGARHVVGCITSWSRKEVIPVLEKLGGTLWYTCPYEGFETNDHVVYMHACPNQHLLPLLAHVIPRFGANAFLVGSNYIWGWETNRVARDLVGDAGGTVFGERYLALGDIGVERLVSEIRATRPNFILNNLIGPSSYAFYEAMAALASEDAYFAADNCPILSCNLTEVELPAIGQAAQGHLAVGPYFGEASGSKSPRGTAGGAASGVVDGPAGGRESATALRHLSSFYAAAKSAVLVFADLMESRRTAAVGEGLDFAGRQFDTPLGRIAIDPATQHASLPVRIGRVKDRRFEIVHASEGRVDPDPYLSRYDPVTAGLKPKLRIVR